MPCKSTGECSNYCQRGPISLHQQDYPANHPSCTSAAVPLACLTHSPAHRFQCLPNSSLTTEQRACSHPAQPVAALGRYHCVRRANGSILMTAEQNQTANGGLATCVAQAPVSAHSTPTPLLVIWVAQVPLSALLHLIIALRHLLVYCCSTVSLKPSGHS